jgi:hypothetical protein
MHAFLIKKEEEKRRETIKVYCENVTFSEKSEKKPSP